MFFAQTGIWKFVRYLGRQSNVRYISGSPRIRSSAYDSDGKTTVTVLNNQPDLGLMVDTYSTLGFRMNNGSLIVGPVALFPKTVLSWNIGGYEDINEKSLELFTILEPRPDVLVVGYGSRDDSKPSLDKKLHKYRVSKNLNMEIVPTDRAVATFNFLNAEGRYVVAVMIPPKFVTVTDEDIANDFVNKKKMYQMDD